MKIFAFASIVLVAFASPCRSQGPELPRTFHCDFDVASSERLTTDKRDAVPSDSIHDVIFAEMDFSNSNAIQILPTGEKNLTLISTGPDTVHLIETAPTGSISVTTIFLKTKKVVDGGGFSYPVYRAAMSRHLATLRGDANVSQLYGLCKGV
jgi:hypothetical protein